MSEIKMRTRNLAALTNFEAERYLERNDVIFIPVGTVELHGPMPMDCEYVAVEALAYKLAEKCNGLVLPHLTYFHPGATDIGRGTVYISMTDGAAYLRSIAQSLLNQGFRRQVFLTAHGPAYMTVIPMLTQFLDETKVPLFYGDLMQLMKDADFKMDFQDFDTMICGAYKLMNRLEDIPLGMNDPRIVITPESDLSHCMPDSSINLMPKNGAGGYFTAWKYGNVLEHGGQCVPIMTAEEREKLADKGIEMLDTLVEKLDFQKKLDALRDLDKFHQDVVMPLYGDWLVRNKMPEPGK
jgi:creatinine amidohydrolase